MLTGLYEDNVIDMTRWHLKCRTEGSVRVVNSKVINKDNVKIL